MVQEVLAGIENLSPSSTKGRDLDGFKFRIQNSHMTEDSDHELVAQILQVNICIHHAFSGEIRSTEWLPSRSTIGPKVHLLYHQKQDGAGVSKGHFDPLVPTGITPQRQVPAEQNPTLGVAAITLKGEMLVSALLSGGKKIENRNFSLEGKWTCLHLGKSAPLKWMVSQINQLLPDLPPAGSMKPGYIHGMIYVDRSESLSKYRGDIGCGSACNFAPDGKHDEEPTHVEGCRCDPFALGPVLNFVKRRIVFHKPIPCSRGFLGRWTLPEETRIVVMEALRTKAFSAYDLDGSCSQSYFLLPEDWFASSR